MLDWIFNGIATWMASTVSALLDAASGAFISALGTDMTTMEEYFPFITKAFSVFQYTAWSLLFLIFVFQLLRTFGGPLTETEHPMALLARTVLFTFLIGYAKPIFSILLDIATIPYEAFLHLQMTAEDYTFSGIQNVLENAISSIATSAITTILIVFLMVAIGWNYIKLLLECVERYIVAGILCYTSPLAFAMGGSKQTSSIFHSWCRMVGSQLLLLVMNVWFLRGFSSAAGSYAANGGALSNGKGSDILWFFAVLAFLKAAQRFDSYLASLGLNAAQTGSGLGMEVMLVARSIAGLGGHAIGRAGSIFGGGSPSGGGSPAGGGPGGGPGGFASGLADKFRPNSYVRDAVVQGGSRMGMGGGVGAFGRMFGGMAAKSGATLDASSLSSVANRDPSVSGKIGGDIADRSLGNYMPHLAGQNLSGTQIEGGHISTKATDAAGMQSDVDLYNASMYDTPDGAYSMVAAEDGSQWYQMASGEGLAGASTIPNFTGGEGSDDITSYFPDAADGTTLRTVDDGVLAATGPDGSASTWLSGGVYEEPEGPHTSFQSSDGMTWYAMSAAASMPDFSVPSQSDGFSGAAPVSAGEFNAASFSNFMPSYAAESPITGFYSTPTSDAYVGSSPVHGSSGAPAGTFEVTHANGSGTRFYDSSQFAAPTSGSYQTYKDSHGHNWFAVRGQASVRSVPVYENGKQVMNGKEPLTRREAYVKYPTGAEAPKRFSNLKKRSQSGTPPRRRK